MSFSSQVKEELSTQISPSRHCKIAELAAIISMCGKIRISEDNSYRVYVLTENIMVARKYFLLLQALFQVRIEVMVRRNANRSRTSQYAVVIPNPEISLKILKMVKLINSAGEIEENLSVVSNMVVKNMCCKRSFIRGAFLSSGSMSNPNKTYHFEITVATEQKAEQIKQIINSFEIDAKIVARKKYFVVYIKEGEQIVDMLNIMEAHVALMELENVRILKEVRNEVNRIVNCETANINKTVNASFRQIEDIKYIKEKVGFGDLSDGLRNIAELRIKHPDLPLKDLGLMLELPLGKSGVNHRLRKLSSIAEGIRERLKEEK